ncbi:MAG: VWA domain-containing protein [Thermoguttaceae bacterium]|nr:VWA domain-containing protein [Thermoguttaceae bacterium]
MTKSRITDRFQWCRENLFSWFGSVLLHALIFAGVFWILSTRNEPGTVLGERRTDSVGIVFSKSRGVSAGPTDGASKTDPVEQDTNPVAKSMSDSEIQELAQSFLPQESRIGIMASHGGTAENSAAGFALPGGRVGSGNSGEGGQTVGFSDLKGTGRRFVYVLDRSESMKWNHERPLRYALQETKASIMSLDTGQGALKFQLVYYNHNADVFENGSLLDVNEKNKKAVCHFLDSLTPTGGTDPVTALQKAMSLKSEVIFFLTDADEEIPPMALERIRELRQKSKTRQIHVVEFGRKSDPVKHSFRQLADENNGTYVFKDIESF